jgi:hypothetical protein
MELIPLSEHLQQQKQDTYIHTLTQHKLSARVKANIKRIIKSVQLWDAPSDIKIISRETTSQHGANINNTISQRNPHWMEPWLSDFCCDNGSPTGKDVQAGLASWSLGDTWTNSLCFPHVVLDSVRKEFLQPILWCKIWGFYGRDYEELRLLGTGNKL